MNVYSQPKTSPNRICDEKMCKTDPCEGSRLTEKLYVGSPLSVLESHSLIFQYAVRHSITNAHLMSCCN